ncbi:MAG: branched-chain amino acid ABC transporter permease [Chloroflexi bacterium]|nr:branched-chain amino acid ABC transporter permease [Chloroflexota bacterium]
MAYLATLAVLGSVAVIAACGLALLAAHGGLYSLGHAGLMAVGAYTAVWLQQRLGWALVPSLAAGALAAALASLLVGYPALRSRLRGDYFAITTLAFGEIVRLTLTNTQVLGGALGKSLASQPAILPLSLASAGLTVAGMQLLVRSSWGLRLRACRMDETAARASGVDVLATQLVALMISAACGGLAGGLLAGELGYLAPALFGLARSTELLAAVVLGGRGALWGTALAALSLAGVPELLRLASEWRMVLNGALLLGSTLWQPKRSRR